MKTILILSLILVACYGFNVNLEKKVVENQIPSGEALYTFKTKLAGEQEVDSVFDIADSYTWMLEKSNCVDCLNGEAAKYDCSKDNTCTLSSDQGAQSYGFAGQVQFTSPKGPNKSYQTGSNDFEIAEQQFTHMKVDFPAQVLPSASDVPQQNLIESAQASIGLGQSKNNGFTRSINNEKHGDVRSDSSQFSFFFGKIQQFVFGTPQGYFKTGDWTTFENTHADTTQQLQGTYALQAKSIKINGTTLALTNTDQDAQANNNVNQKITQYAIFSSTSKYISIQNQNTLNSIVKVINQESGANCVEKGSKNYYFSCDKSSNFPDLQLTLKGKYNSKEFTLKPEDYTETVTIDGTEQVVLLIRRGLYGQQSYVLSNLQGGGSQHYIWLGYPFFNRYYVNFNYNNDQIQIADKFDVTPEPTQIDNSYYLTLLILGGIGALGAVAFILATLTKVPFNGIVSQPKPQLEQSTVKAQPQVLRTISNLSPKNNNQYIMSSKIVSSPANVSTSQLFRSPQTVSYIPQQNVRVSQARTLQQ